MIQMQTTLAAADNSGAKELMCIKVLGGSKRRYAGIGDIIKVSIRDAQNFALLALVVAGDHDDLITFANSVHGVNSVKMFVKALPARATRSS